MYIWVNYNDLTVLPNPGIMVKKGNHSQMAQEFRIGKYYNLPRSISYTIIIFQYTIIIYNNTICSTNLLQYVSLYHYPTRWGFLWVLLSMFLYRVYHGFICLEIAAMTGNGMFTAAHVFPLSDCRIIFSVIFSSWMMPVGWRTIVK